LDSDDESEEMDVKPKAIIQKKIIGKDTTIEVLENGIISKMFKIEDIDILVIRDKDKNYWYKGKHLCDILLYKNTTDALIRHVSKEYKKSYADMGVGKHDGLKIDPQTVFTDDRGLFQLVSRSKKETAIELWRKITKEILPTLFATGTYTLEPHKTDIDRLNKSFYDDNMLSDYWNNPVIYLSYIGKYKGEHKMKYGYSTNFVRRDLDEHRKTFNIFNIMGIWKTLAYKLVEDKIEANFTSKNMIKPLEIIQNTKKGNKKKYTNRNNNIE